MPVPAAFSEASSPGTAAGMREGNGIPEVSVLSGDSGSQTWRCRAKLPGFRGVSGCRCRRRGCRGRGLASAGPGPPETGASSCPVCLVLTQAFGGPPVTATPSDGVHEGLKRPGPRPQSWRPPQRAFPGQPPVAQRYTDTATAPETQDRTVRGPR